jgi:hypothetical protein
MHGLLALGPSDESNTADQPFNTAGQLCGLVGLFARQQRPLCTYIQFQSLKACMNYDKVKVYLVLLSIQLKKPFQLRQQLAQRLTCHVCVPHAAVAAYCAASSSSCGSRGEFHSEHLAATTQLQPASIAADMRFVSFTVRRLAGSPVFQRCRSARPSHSLPSIKPGGLAVIKPANIYAVADTAPIQIHTAEQLDSHDETASRIKHHVASSCLPIRTCHCTADLLRSFFKHACCCCFHLWRTPRTLWQEHPSRHHLPKRSRMVHSRSLLRLCERLQQSPMRTPAQELRHRRQPLLPQQR